jgi:hypothetical protein
MTGKKLVASLTLASLLGIGVCMSMTWTNQA